jgi:hypothetical protein
MPLWKRMYIEECDANGSRTYTLPQYCWRNIQVGNLISLYLMGENPFKEEVGTIDWRQEGF